MSTTRVPQLPPTTDPTPLFDHFRGQYVTSLVVVAVTEFNLFGYLAAGPQEFDRLRELTHLADRPLQVLLTAMRALGVVERHSGGRYSLTPVAIEHLVPGGDYYVGDYFSLARDSAEVKDLAARFRTNRPRGADGAGAGFIFRDGLKSAMEEAEAARHFTLALSGRAKNVAPVLAKVLPLPEAKCLVDMGGGTGIYSIALLRANPKLRAVIWDRPEVLRIAAEFAAESGVADRLEFHPGDFFTDTFPPGADVVLLSNILHDWDVPEAHRLVRRAAEVLPSGGRLLVHDVFLDDDLGGPLPAALFSVNLFAVTEGRLYSAAEIGEWMQNSGLQPGVLRPTLVHAQVFEGIKKS